MDANAARAPLERFFDSGVPHPTLGLVYGRRRIGKSTLLADLTTERRGFYWEATRGESPIHLARLGSALGEHLGVGRLSFEDWEEALAQLLRLGEPEGTPVVIDEFGYLLEADPTLDSLIATALGPASRKRGAGGARLILCGSAIALMSSLTAGQAPLRGRAGLEIVMQPFGYRAAGLQVGGGRSLELAVRVFAVIGGVIGYHTDMVDHDLPDDPDDFERWISARVLSRAATLHHEATTLLAEDPTLAAASPTLHHSLLGAIATGSVRAGGIANRLRRPVSNLDPHLKRLIASGFVVRHEDPIRARRPTYALADPFLQFHYAVLEPHRAILRDREPRRVWRERLAATFGSHVLGPVFEELARSWVRRHASASTLGTPAEHVGPSTIVREGVSRQVDLVVAGASGPGTAPAEREVYAVGEAKAGQTVGRRHLQDLEAARTAIGTRAAHAKLMVFAPAFTDGLRREAARRSDVELVDLERLYHGE